MTTTALTIDYDPGSNPMPVRKSLHYDLTAARRRLVKIEEVIEGAPERKPGAGRYRIRPVAVPAAPGIEVTGDQLNEHNEECRNREWEYQKGRAVMYDKVRHTIDEVLDLSHRRTPSAERYRARPRTADGLGVANEMRGHELGDRVHLAMPQNAAEFFEAVKRSPRICVPMSMFEDNDGTGDKELTVLYRGDDRKPDEMFAAGFEAREEHTQIIFRTTKSESDSDGGSGGTFEHGQFDIAPQTAVCASAVRERAGIFPLLVKKPKSSDPTAAKDVKAPEIKTYVYAFVPDRYLNTYKLQETIYPSLSSHLATLTGLLLAKEAAVHDRVPSDRVLGAYPVTQRWRDTNWTDGVELSFGEFMRNPNVAEGLASRVKMAPFTVTFRTDDLQPPVKVEHRGRDWDDEPMGLDDLRL